MTLPEWIECQALIVAFWPHAPHLTEQQIRLQHQLVAHIDQQQAQHAISAHARSGREFPPTPGQIVAATTELPDAPTWPEAKALIVQACGRFGRDREADGLRWLAGRAPQVARFCADQWKTLCLDGIDGEKGGAVEHRWRADYAQVCRQMSDETAQGQLRPVVRDRLAHLEHGQPGARRGLRQMNPAAALPATAGEIEGQTA